MGPVMETLHSDGNSAREGLLDPAEYQLLSDLKQ